jgi:hypothetical protein
MEKGIRLENLSPSELDALSAELEARRKAERERVKAERETYKSLVNDSVDSIFPMLSQVSHDLSVQKQRVYDTFAAALNMKAELYDVPADQQTHTFTNEESTRRVIIGNHMNDAYDDTVSEGIAKVKGYISSLSKDAESKLLVDAILKLLSRDQKGNLKASRVIQLGRMAEQSNDAEFIDGVRIINEAYRPAISKQFVRAEYKNSLGEWVNVPLGMTEA